MKQNTQKKKATVVDAKVVIPQGFSNTAMVDFNLEGEKETFAINFYDDNRRGIMYMYPQLYQYADSPHDSEDISKQILELFKAKGESLYEDVGPWGNMARKERGLQ
ncbi:hypothetical protein [Paenibacillus polymyxa]|uniref:hypothetical protein n=1 Tax=Paenibacillus polymyxa TaxID=1406 RepID=UPI00287F4C95|nr:hypothetical protein [Paenibacillus polymyxa]